MNIEDMKGKDLFHDAVSLGFKSINKNTNGMSEFAGNDPLMADVMMYNEEKKVLLMYNGGMEESATNVFMYMAVDKSHQENQLDDIPGTFFYQGPESGNFIGTLDVKDDLFDSLEQIMEHNLTPAQLSLESNILSLLPVWGEQNPMKMTKDELAKELHQHIGEFTEQVFDVPEDVMDRTYNRSMSSMGMRIA